MNNSRDGLRSLATSFLLWLSFLSACLFYGAGENLLLLFISCGFLLFAGALTPIDAWRDLLVQRRMAVLVCLYVVVVLCIHYFLVTISPDNSFAMSWLLAALILWYLVAATNSSRRILLLLIVGTVLLSALYSAWQFLSSGQRAYEPLGDPNHYASVLYLVWIPLAHRYLLKYGNPSVAWPVHTSAHIALFVLVLAISATDSRVGMVIVACALVGWLVLVIARRLPPRPWILLLVNTSAAVLLWWLADPGSLPGAVDAEDFRSGVDVRSALTMASLRMSLESPLWGSGIFTFPLLYPLFRLPGDQSTAGMFVHNDYLQLFVESGPWLVAVLLVLGIAVSRLLWRGAFTNDDAALRKFGFAMAAAALLAHASVNYVIYFLPLGIMLAVVCAELFGTQEKRSSVTTAGAVRADTTEAPASAAARGVWLAVLVAGFVSWSYLGLDVVTQGVFGGQARPGPIRALQRDAETMGSYARLARRLNDRRVTPVLAQAMLFTAMLERDPGAAVSKTAILDRYRLALAMDPYNSVIYQQLYDFIAKHGDADLIAELTPEESPERLLLAVVQLELGRTPSVFRLLSIYDQQGESDKALRLLKTGVYPWLERVARARPSAAQAMLDEMLRRAQAADDRVFVAQLEDKAEQLRAVKPDTRIERAKAWQHQLLR